MDFFIIVYPNQLLGIMKIKLAMILLLVLSVNCFAQKADIKFYIDAWKVADTSQTHRAEETYDKMRALKDTCLLKETVHALYAYLDKHPDDRLKVRIDMYDVLSKKHYNLQLVDLDSAKLYHDIKLTHKLKDEQLRAELYTLYAEVGANNHLLYNLKAIELEKKLGIKHFRYIHTRYFNASLGLYHNNEYRQSINYGLQCLAYKNVPVNTWDSRVYVFQLDIIGASYLKLAKYDSAKYYYQKIIDTLSKKPDPVPHMQKLWLGIAKGNIGHALILQGHEAEGLALVDLQLTCSREVKSFNNMAIAQNILAAIDYRHKRYIESLKKWRQAYVWAIQSEYDIIEQKILALQGIADSYRKLNQTDSAYKYDRLYFNLSNQRVVDVNSRQLSALKVKIQFDDMQNSLEHINERLAQEKLIRNLILIGIALLSVISLLLYNRQRLKNMYKAEMLEREREIAEKEVVEAKEKINEFTRNIREKENLISVLKQTIGKNNSVNKEEIKTLNDNLLNYVLLTDSEWTKFKEAFNKAYPIFFSRLKELIPRINPAEERLASLICLQLNNHQIANMLGIGADSVGRSKRRLKNRINLPEDTTLEDYISKLND